MGLTSCITALARSAMANLSKSNRALKPQGSVNANLRQCISRDV